MFLRAYPTLFLLANSLTYAILVWLFVSAAPTWFANLGIGAVNAAGQTELRATYIGLFAGLAAYFLLCSWLPHWRAAGVVLALLSYLGLALVRGYGIFVLRQSSDLMMQLLVSEIILVLLALLGLYCLHRQRKTTRNPYL